MVTLRTVGNVSIDEAKLTEKQLADIRQAKYYNEKSRELIHGVVFSDEFRKNNKNPGDWTSANAAICYYAIRSDDDIKKEIIYE